MLVIYPQGNIRQRKPIAFGPYTRASLGFDLGIRDRLMWSIFKSIAVQPVLFNFGFKTLFNKRLPFPPFTATSMDCFMQLLKFTGCQECYLFFKLIKHVFLLTGTFN